MKLNLNSLFELANYQNLFQHLKRQTVTLSLFPREKTESARLWDKKAEPSVNLHQRTLNLPFLYWRSFQRSLLIILKKTT